MRKLLFALLTLVTWFSREWLKEVFWEGILHVLNPENSLLLQYGPPVAFAAVVLYLFLKDKSRTRAEMIGIVFMIFGGCLFLFGVFLYRGETGRLPFFEEAEKSSPKESDEKKPKEETVPNFTERFGDISKLSNQQLRSLTAQFAEELRLYEQNNPNMMMDMPHQAKNETQEQFNKRWREAVNRDSDLSARSNEVFSNAYKLDMLSLLTELKERLRKKGILLPITTDADMPAFMGVRAGVHPIADGADYLEMLSRKLPD